MWYEVGRYKWRGCKEIKLSGEDQNPSKTIKRLPSKTIIKLPFREQKSHIIQN